MHKIINSEIDLNNQLDLDFFLDNTEIVARKLLGKIFCRKFDNTFLAGRIVETEAYLALNDPSSHSRNGETVRNRAMFCQGGILYVYFIYGVHHCVNIVTEPAGIGAAVLLRAFEPLAGIDFMVANRQNNNVNNLCRGPGNITKAFGIDKSYNFTSCVSSQFFILDAPSLPDQSIAITKRIGVKKDDQLLLRFYEKKSRFVSGNKS